MKKNLSKFYLLIALMTWLSVGAQINNAQIKTGGYKVVPANDAEAVAAAEFAVNAQSDKEQLDITMDAVIKAERQVVAGTNYRLCLQILSANPDEEVVEQFVQVVVFRNLKKEYSLKSWAERDSCE